MAIVVITEFPGVAGQTLQTIQAAGPKIAENAYTVTAGSVTSSFTFSARTNLIRICCVAANIAYSMGPSTTASGPVATTTSTPLVSGSVEYRGVNPGDAFAAVTI